MAHKRPTTYVIVSYVPSDYRMFVEKVLYKRRESLLESLDGMHMVHTDVINPFGHITAREQQFREDRLDDVSAGIIDQVIIYGNRHTPYLGAVFRAFRGFVQNKAERDSQLDFAIQEHNFARNTRTLP